MTLDNLVGIPWKLNGKDFSGTDCVYILYMYYRFVKGWKIREPLLKLKRCNQDNDYLETLIPYWNGKKVSKHHIKPDDIVVFFIEGEIHAGVCLPFDKFLHSTKSVGSCIEHLRDDYKNCIIYGVRLYA